MKVGDVRLAKVDSLNYCVQEYRKITNPKTKETREEWVDVEYFGDHIDWAAKSALMLKVPANANLLGEFQTAAAEIVAAIREASK